MTDDPFGLTSFVPTSTGLPVIVWVGTRGAVKIEGSPSASDPQAVSAWIERNRDALTEHWDGHIDAIQLGARLRRV
jgi:hypothetical protein